MNRKECSHSPCRKSVFQKNDKCIFHCEKEEGVWFDSKNDKKVWRDDLVEKFWKEIREKKMAKEDYNFSYFIFPKSEEYNEKGFNFWQNKNFQFSDGVKFNYSVFLSDIYFINIVFKDWNEFSNTKFKGTVRFSSTKEFTQRFIFQSTEFHKNVSFYTTNKKSKYLVIFTQNKFSKTHQSLFQGVNFVKSRFVNIVFPEKVLFRGCDLSEVSFLGSNIEKVQFDECTFKKSEQGNSMLYDEIPYKDFEKIETLYRQFKKNFDEKKDFKKADDFYVGEMKMIRNKLKEKQKYIFCDLFLDLFCLFSF